MPSGRAYDSTAGPYWRKASAGSSLKVTPTRGVAAETELRPVRTAFLAVLWTIWLLPAVSTAAESLSDQVVRFAIPRQRADKALIEFAEQANLTFIFPAEQARKVTANAVQGEFTPEVAIALLLRGTGLEPRTKSGGSLTVDASSQSTDEGETVKKRSLLMSIVAVLAGSAATAEASADQESSPVQLNEIVVTAQKRKERLLDAPQSVTVLSADALDKLGATQFRDFANTIPGLTFVTQGVGFTKLTLRGVTTGGDINSTVGVYIDEVPQGSSTAYAQTAELALDVALFDIERIEVLRGPQGTLYGASTMGGLVKYVTNAPDTTRFGGELQAGLSSTEKGGVGYKVAGVLNAPLVSDTLGLRATGYYSRDGGFIDNIALDRNDVDRASVYGGRLDLLFTPTDALSLRVDTFLQNISRDGTAVADYTIAGPVNDELEQSNAVPEPFDQQFRQVSATLSYELPVGTLTAVSAYQTADTDFFIDFSAPPTFLAFAQQVSTDKFTQEIRFVSKADQTLEWLIGGFYADENSENGGSFDFYDADGNAVPPPLFTNFIPTHYEEIAFFGDLTWHLSPRLDVTGGVRYAENRQRVEQFATGILEPQPLRRIEENVTTYLGNLRYRLNENQTAYLRYATGYRPGGPNIIANDPVTGEPLADPLFESDRLKSYELGYRAQTADGRFSADLSTYYIDWTDIQIIAQRGGFFVRANAAGGAEIYGAELALSAHPIDPLSISAVLAYGDSRLSETDAELGGEEGEELPGTAPFAASLIADYTLPGTWQPTVGATIKYVPKRESSFSSAPVQLTPLDSYTAVDLRVSFNVGVVDAQIYLRNAFDERGMASIDTFGNIAILQPRTFGITLTSHF